MIMTNVSGGNIYVGLIANVKGKFTCNFVDGGLCAGAGGANTPVAFTEPLGTFSSCAAALAAYKAHTMLPHAAFGGERIFFSSAALPSPLPTTPPSSAVAYFIDNESAWCVGGAASTTAPATTASPTTTATTPATTTPASSPTTSCASSLHGRRLAAASANQVTVVCVTPDCSARNGGEWQTLTAGAVLAEGWEIACDPDGSATLQFAGGSTVSLKPTTQIKIAAFFQEGGAAKAEILLRIGEVAADVKKSGAVRSDFQIRSPTVVASVRGTQFAVYYAPSTGTTIVSSIQDPVLVTPNNPKLPPVTITTDKEVALTPTSESKIAPIGRAGAPPGGVDQARATTLVLARIGLHGRSCGFAPRGTVVKIALSGTTWEVAVKTLGTTHGWSTWSVKGTRVAAVNALAATIAAGCKR